MKRTHLLALALGAVLAAMVAMIVVTEREAQAALSEKIVFDSDRTTGQGVNNPTGDYEIFKMNPDGTGVNYAFFSSDGTRIFYESSGVQDSNLQGDNEIYRLNTLDGNDQRNLTNNDAFDGVYPD